MNMEDRDDAILYYEFKYKTIMEIVGVIVKVISFYLVVSIASIGYIFTKEININEQGYLLISGGIISILFVIVLISIFYGVMTGLRDVETTLKKINSTLFIDLGMDRYFFRGKLVSLIVMICAVLIAVTIGSGFLIKYIQ